MNRDEVNEQAGDELLPYGFKWLEEREGRYEAYRELEHNTRVAFSAASREKVLAQIDSWVRVQLSRKDQGWLADAPREPKITTGVVVASVPAKSGSASDDAVVA